MAAARVSIPAAMRRMIQDIKEIAGGHADEEVYAVLCECDMDPNEAAQRLLSRGTFHEVKRKRDKKKESRKEPSDPRLRPGVQGRDVKCGQGNYSPRELPNSNDSKRSAALEDTEGVTTSLLDVSQSIKPHISAVDPIHSLSLEARSHDEISTKHDFSNQQTTAVLEVSSQPSSSVRPSGNMLSSSYNTRNPKSTNKPTQAENVMFEDVPIRVGTVTLSVPVLNSARKEDLSLKVDKRLTEMQLSDKQHVIIPDHLQVTESEKYGLSFGSFGTSLEQTAPKGPECEKGSAPPEDDSPQELHEVVCEPAISCQGASTGIDMEAHKGLQQLSVDDSSLQRVYGSSETSEIAGSDAGKDFSGASHIPQDSVAHSTKHDDQTQVPQANDNSEGYHTKIYQPIADVDGGISPFAAPVAPIKYGNIPVSHVQTGEAEEGINSNSFVVPSPGSSPFVPSASGVVPSSIAVPQPPVPLFRQPVGVPLAHYAPSFIPYNHYISPFYYPPHALNHFMGTAAVFPQSPSSGSMYPPVSASVAPQVKYSSSAYKTDENTGSQAQVGIPGAYTVYGSSPSVYTNTAVVMNGASVETDDAIGSQFKESNVFVAGQQSDGSTVWIPAPGQDVSLLQPTSFGVSALSKDSIWHLWPLKLVELADEGIQRFSCIGSRSIDFRICSKKAPASCS
ncbi:hypothetical protein PR202_gb29244 [Eleusine coracana subsp. coracana]|uniref:GBF-interacting protein 1 N-terminal domain-containing protein n=1 Tax=Eleusine coracana subsp. coracana TaxID=191504 RepID=A0AAV5FYG3_ELECO|nr:hypothetical protein PR202_gb29244 [Eleusine coracana subsp. coracana]